jgi:hypothetical protein
VSVDLTRHTTGSRPHQGTRDRRMGAGRLSRGSRRDLARRDLASARLAELHAIKELLTSAAVLVSGGWVQHGWFSVADGQGRSQTVDAHHLHLLDDRPVSGGCLVGAVVHAAGGPTTVRSQLVQRTLDVLWHALYEGARQPVRWCPAPSIRMAHVRDVTRWNDAPRRTATQAEALLRSAVGVAEAEIARVRASTVALQTA